VAWATHVGPYEKIPETIGQILTWMEANGFSQAGPVVEQYADIKPRTNETGKREDRSLDPLPQEGQLIFSFLNDREPNLFGTKEKSRSRP